ncbi:spore germination protein GerW family protein [Evansella tamaricis]|uniref:Sporulation protein YtfJ n=1 Tax=Evansella tamaricis TaxID=2069301 RepID=A0ABS6JBP8_9BACI|nr:spore germination protein GerW family protein [Evansella tamaricis]MBU9710928.1 hypothetical protein [Evansella tamaricis]
MESNSQEEVKSGYEMPIKPILSKFLRNRDVSLVFGDPIEVGEKKIVPVSKSTYMGGGGGGFTDRTEESPQAEGGGGGGRISVTPYGVYEISSEKTSFKPAIDLKFLLILSSIFTFGLVWLLIKASNYNGKFNKK